MKWHITIKDNETGEIEIDTDTNAIIGAVAGSDNDEYSEAYSLGLAECSATTMIGTLKSAKEAIDKIYAKEKSLEYLAMLVERADDIKTETEMAEDDEEVEQVYSEIKKC